MSIASVKALGCTVIRGSSPEHLERMKMKFDVVVGNPPFNVSIKKGDYKTPFSDIGPHGRFVHRARELLKEGGYLAMVLPCNFMGLPSARQFRDWVLANYKLTQLKVIPNKGVFAISLSDIVTLVAKKEDSPNNTKVPFGDFKVNLEEFTIWPIFQSALSVSIYQKLIASRKRNIISGSQKTKPTKKALVISGNLTRLGERVNPEPREQFVFGKLKPVKAPIWFEYSTKQEQQLQWEWMATPHYAHCLALVQSTPKNQPIFFASMGEHDFSTNDFNNHFKLTKEEIAYIEATVKHGSTHKVAHQNN
jgi:hypothetical protein